MPSMNDYLNLIYVNLGFLAQITIMVYFKSVLEIKENWPLYRCNPPYWIFSQNISEDFTYCVQNTQLNMMDYLLQPLNYMLNLYPFFVSFIKYKMFSCNINILVLSFYFI